MNDVRGREAPLGKDRIVRRRPAEKKIGGRRHDRGDTPGVLLGRDRERSLRLGLDDQGSWRSRDGVVVGIGHDGYALYCWCASTSASRVASSISPVDSSPFASWNTARAARSI